MRNKRKRAASPTPSLSDDEDAKSQYSRSEAAASTNPLSLAPIEVVQYRLAGLELDEQIPDVKGWPHRGFRGEQTHISRRNKGLDIKGKGKERIKDVGYNNEGLVDRESGLERTAKMEDETGKKERRPRLRLQHLSVLTTILQRCLLEGDIPRAGRAWAMLIRAQVGGKGIDLKGSGYWAIGAELLIKAGETKPSPRRQRDSDAEIQDGGEQEQDDGATEAEQKGEKRYGSADGLEKAKEYYERLILQHPYKRQFHGNVSALEFWPAMVGCEIYGIQHEQKESLRKVAESEENEDDEALGSQSDLDPEPAEEDEDIYAAEERRKVRERNKRSEKRWQERDEIRKTAFAAYEKLAARLDELMTTPPYSDSHVLLRLRGMLALCIGDLMVPALPIDEEDSDEDGETLERNRRLGIGGKDTEQRLLVRQRIGDLERGKKKQKEEHVRARRFFERIEREIGRKEGVMDSLPGEEEDVEESYNAE